MTRRKHYIFFSVIHVQNKIINDMTNPKLDFTLLIQLEPLQKHIITSFLYLLIRSGAAEHTHIYIGNCDTMNIYHLAHG